MKSSFFGALSLRQKLVLAFLLLSLFAGFALAFLANQSSVEVLHELVGADLNTLAVSKALAVGGLVARQLDALQSLSLDPVLRAYVIAANSDYVGDDTLPDAAAIRAQLAALDQRWRASAGDDDPFIRSTLQNPASAELQFFQQRFPDHVEVFLTDRYGGLVAASGRTEDYYQADESWWTPAYHDGRGAMYVGALAWDESSRFLGVRLVTPVYDRDHTTWLGALVSIYRMNTLNELAMVPGAENSQIGVHLVAPGGLRLSAGGNATEKLADEDWRQCH